MNRRKELEKIISQGADFWEKRLVKDIVDTILKSEREMVEGLEYKGEYDINDVHVGCACKFNLKINQLLKSMDGANGNEE